VLYLLDANILITAHNQYYEIDRIPEYWEWLLHLASKDIIKIPLEIFEEITDGRPDDKLCKWIKQPEVKSNILLNEETNIKNVQHVINFGYNKNSSNPVVDAQIDSLGKDPFLIAYGLASPNDRCIVTNEVPSNRKGFKQKIPDVCKHFDIQTCNVYDLIKKLDFSTSWKSRSN
jgi:hypothetical protein